MFKWINILISLNLYGMQIEETVYPSPNHVSTPTTTCYITVHNFTNELVSIQTNLTNIIIGLSPKLLYSCSASSPGAKAVTTLLEGLSPSMGMAFTSMAGFLFTLDESFPLHSENFSCLFFFFLIYTTLLSNSSFFPSHFPF